MRLSTDATFKNRFFATKAETARVSRPKQIRRDFPGKVETARPIITFSRRRRGRGRRVFPDQGGDGATKKQFFATKAETARFFRPRKSARLSRPRRGRRYFSDQGGDDATKNHFLATMAETARLFRPRSRRRDFPDRDGDGDIFRPRGDDATKNQFPATNSRDETNCLIIFSIFKPRHSQQRVENVSKQLISKIKKNH